MTDEIVLRPVAVVRNEMREIIDDVFGGTVSRIELDGSRFGPEALVGLSEFSHVEVIFYMHGIVTGSVEMGARHPRGRKDWPKVGIFAQRAKFRPNQIGATVCRLRKVEGLILEVENLDAIDGTPVLDIKPFLEEFGPRGEVRQPAWAKELMAGYWAGSGQ